MRTKTATITENNVHILNRNEPGANLSVIVTGTDDIKTAGMFSSHEGSGVSRRNQTASEEFGWRSPVTSAH